MQGSPGLLSLWLAASSDIKRMVTATLVNNMENQLLKVSHPNVVFVDD